MCSSFCNMINIVDDFNNYFWCFYSKLIDLVNEYGERKWAFIAEKMTGRAGKQCRERWRNHLHPDIKVLFLALVFVCQFIYKDLYWVF